MNIIVFGAGAIGSFLGGLLSKSNTVVLIGRAPHITKIQENGLIIQGKTTFQQKIPAYTDIKETPFEPELIILTTKSYDTEQAVKHIASVMTEQTHLLTFQNGLDNIDKIKQFIPKKQILAAITTQGCLYNAPGIITHTGVGRSLIGELNGKKTSRVNDLVKMFQNAGFPIKMSTNILKEIWMKGIINSSINPLTASISCKNGRILQNPILHHLMEKICTESTRVANTLGYKLSSTEMIQRTQEVIEETKENYSSMVQSLQRNQPTEINSINGMIIKKGLQTGCNISCNQTVTKIIQELEQT